MRSAAGFLALSVALGFSGIAGAAPATSGNKFYCCTDTTGKQVCGDILPQACFGRAYRELGAALAGSRDDVLVLGTGPNDGAIRNEAGQIVAVTRLVCA